MPSLVGSQAGMNVYDYRSPGYNYNGVGNNHDLSYAHDDTFDRDDMRREEEDRFKRNARNGGPPYDRFVDYLADRDRGGMVNAGGGEPTFLLDHLATFAAGTRNGPLHAEDGLRKLRQMENTTGIWTMRCQLVVERGFLVIVDNGNGEELERFPIQNVTDPTAIFKNDHREHYNSLILFTIVDDPKKKITQADMHIFQTCGGNPPQVIVDEILASKAGQPRLGGAAGSKIPPPPVGPAPEPPNGAYNFQNMRDYLENQNQRDHYGQTQFGASSRVPQNSMLARVSAIREKEDIDGGTTEIMERDVQLLNHCFDDIEKFVARLQQAAEAFKELERRKRERGAKNKKRQSGDGMLNARARPPNDRDFVDIFQKFKLSFNLLAKLKAHIHDPNAPELVHFLFTPLSLIYEASRDPYHGNQNLGDQAVAPVLTVEAKMLLQNCLTSKELELWHALGKHWTTSRSEWQGHIPPYVPQFFDGWQPAGSVIDEVASRSASMHQGPNMMPMSEPIRAPPMNDHPVQYHGPPARPTPFPDEDLRTHQLPGLDRLSSNHLSNNNIGYNNGPSTNNFSHHNGDLERPPNKFPLMTRQDENAQYLEDLMRMDDTLVYEAAHDRLGKNSKELDVQKGDILHVLDNSKNWWKLRNYKGVVGFAPYTILKAIRSEEELERDEGGHLNTSRSALDAARQSSRRANTSPRRVSNIYSELPTNHGNDVGFGAVKTALVNISPSTIPLPPPPPPLPQAAATLPMRQQHNLSEYSNPASSALRQRPPSPPWATRLPAPPSAGHSLNVNRTSRGSITAESIIADYEDDGISLSDVEMRRPSLNREHIKELDAKASQSNNHHQQQQNHTHWQNRHSRMVLNYLSPPDEVAAWLKYKGFKQSAIDVFLGYSGHDMFSLHLEDIQDVLLHEDAVRLDGLLRLQKNASGYKTKTSRELNQILQRRMEHVKNTDWQQQPQQTETSEETVTDFRENGLQQSQQQHQEQNQNPDQRKNSYKLDQYHHQLQQQQQNQQQQQQQQNKDSSTGKTEMRHQPQVQQQQQLRQAEGLPDYRNIAGTGPGSQHNFKDLLVRQRSQLKQSQSEDRLY